MKLLVVAAILGACSAARLDNAYLPPRGGAGAGYGAGSGAGAGGFGNGFGRGGAGGAGFGGAGAGAYGGAGAGGFGNGAGFGAGGAGAGAGAGSYQGGFGGRSNSADANAQILRLNNEVTAEGFSYDFETSNGIRADASGVATNGVQSQGSFAYKGDDGQDYSITYTADENGYQPRGAHLPTPPPIPEAILKSLEQNARDEAAGIVDDGSYRGEGAGNGAGSYSGQGGYSSPSSQYGAPSRGFGGGAGGSSAFGGSSGSSGFGGSTGGSSFGGSSAFNGAASRQYLAPNAGSRGSGNGNFNSQTGYRY
ncbi:pupal cuticle protein 36-like [Vanessa atalanta]|uniref:pupal cuticle protein 36-like n=1 Tax=Vanessa atalanta TaxID=42275 RepID=UPI001FCDE623|nr:pupal cuticle protein 36-like [Vanessa atalanta]